MTFRSFSVVAHRWIGLASTLVMIVAGVTGVLLIWPLHLGNWVGNLHVNMGMGKPGQIFVLACTWASVLLIISGLYLWWKSKTLRIRTSSGWRALAIDLHYSLGVITLLITLVIALSGALRAHLPQGRPRAIVSRLHTAARFPPPVQVVYAVGSIAFVVEGVTGVVMWAAKQGRGRRQPDNR